MESVQLKKEELVERAARSVRPAVHLEMAYDVLDELSRSPEKYPEQLAKLSRIVVKVLNDVEDELEHNPQNEELQKARNRLAAWGGYVAELAKRLEEADDRERIRMVRLFCAMALAPDKLTVELKKLLKGR
ncbi:type I-A CRISPR-associated protein Csa5 [Thermoproteus tenax]|uniref:CRISPR system associated protein Csa5 n=1 Tax=Thermoproteus tenax (strain ATCC 35583 / DSM 2078 / JCM 9277 / NBRC 100435 / Kra 1) TaxID=768679 RepID=CSA5_THETK|nr:type I-A CRISPR-associated protein Csa5 [Thermoproteus tenax]G4RJZ0.1 RecName: Full=CRISPR system associated protein Csa5 [Thermoproteus tenax Kra 1]CCC81885.1 CRISPR system associated protein [Thermoproteus tenax Kra 1]